MEGEDGDAVLVRQVIQVGVLMGVPTLIHHDLDPVVPRLYHPTVDPIQAKRIQRAGAEDYRDRH